jgi:hypothetical protein
MYSFFVLGLIPDTSLQITFLVWQDSLFIAVEFMCLVWLCRRHPSLINRTIHRLAYQLTYSLLHIRPVLLTRFKNVKLLEDEVWQLNWDD